MSPVVSCPECGKPVSPLATGCPHCGRGGIAQDGPKAVPWYFGKFADAGVVFLIIIIVLGMAGSVITLISAIANHAGDPLLLLLACTVGLFAQFGLLVVCLRSLARGREVRLGADDGNP